MNIKNGTWSRNANSVIAQFLRQRLLSACPRGEERTNFATNTSSKPAWATRIMVKGRNWSTTHADHAKSKMASHHTRHFPVGVSTSS